MGLNRWERELKRIQSIIASYWDNDLNSVDGDEGVGIYAVRYVKNLERENMILTDRLNKIKKQGDK